MPAQGLFSRSPVIVRGPRVFAGISKAPAPPLLPPFCFAESPTHVTARQNAASLSHLGWPPRPPPVTLTPSAFGFVQSPTHVTARWIGAAQLGLGNWGWTPPPPPPARTPSAFGFSESPTHVTVRWIGAARLELGNWGWAPAPPVPPPPPPGYPPGPLPSPPHGYTEDFLFGGDAKLSSGKYY